MAIEIVIQPYEFLIRFQNGAVSGAHYRTIELITDGTTVFSSKEGDAQPVEMGGQLFAQIMGETNAGLSAALSAASAERDKLLVQNDALAARVAELEQAAAQRQTDTALPAGES